MKAFLVIMICSLVTVKGQYNGLSQYGNNGAGRGSQGSFQNGNGVGSFQQSGSNYQSSYQQQQGSLEDSIPGIPGQDYPVFAEVPKTSFTCNGQVNGGYYADPDAQCQVFHVCSDDGAGGLTQYSFLCPNGTIFNQNYFICDWWFNFDCSQAQGLYSINDQIAQERAALGNFAPQASYGYPQQSG